MTRYAGGVESDVQIVSFVIRLFWQMTGLMLIRMETLAFGAGILLRSLGLWRGFATKWNLLD